MEDLFDILKESHGEKGMGSSSGREKYSSKEGTKGKDTGGSDPKKSRVKIYNSIKDALKRGFFGQIFSTKNADRLYVITRHKWGKDHDQQVGDRVAKGFTPGSTPSNFKDVKNYAVRTMVKHGKEKSKSFKGPKHYKGAKDE